MKGKAADRNVLFRVVREIKVTSAWLGCVLVILLIIAKGGRRLNFGVSELTCERITL